MADISPGCGEEPGPFGEKSCVRAKEGAILLDPLEVAGGCRAPFNEAVENAAVCFLQGPSHASDLVPVIEAERDRQVFSHGDSITSY